MVEFKEERKGYSKEQVSEYIKVLNGEYQKLTDEYQKLEKEHQNLLDKMKSQEQDTSYTDAIASTLIKAEMSGKQIVSDAQVEAESILYQAKQESSNINRVRQMALEEIGELSKKLQSILSKEEEQ